MLRLCKRYENEPENDVNKIYLMTFQRAARSRACDTYRCISLAAVRFVVYISYSVARSDCAEKSSTPVELVILVIARQAWDLVAHKIA